MSYLTLLFWLFDHLVCSIRHIPIIFLQTILHFSSSPPSHHHHPPRACGPLLAFSAAGMLWSYYIGVIAFLRDHFDLHKSHVCLSGISAGCSAVLVIFLDLTIEQGFEFGLEWQRLSDSRVFKLWFLDTSEVMRMILHKFKSFGITDAVLKQKYLKYGGAGCIHFGVSVFHYSFLFLQHRLLNNFLSVKQMVYAALCSMRILPFFKSLGWYDGYFCVDGAVTSLYSIPSIYRSTLNNNKVIRIGVLANVRAEISPKHLFYPHEFVIAGDLERNLVRFNQGYKDASRFGNVLKHYIQKGLIWSNAQINCDIFDKYNERNRIRKEWNAYVDKRITQWNERIVEHMEICEGKQR